jgi:hypothetical protein
MKRIFHVVMKIIYYGEIVNRARDGTINSENNITYKFCKLLMIHNITRNIAIIARAIIFETLKRFDLAKGSVHGT